MKALSIRQPWAWLIIRGYKDIENRRWALPSTFRAPQRIYVHAGKTMDVNVPGMSLTEDWILERLTNQQRYQYHLQPKVRGAIVGEVTVAGCCRSSGSLWFEGPFGFLLTDPVEYDVPVPLTGHLGFFEVAKLPEELCRPLG